jgi:DNA end-binding protein Ku
MAKRHRAYWKGYLRLSLVTIAVEVYNAIESQSEISFRQIHKPSGRRVNYEKVVQGLGKIENADIVKGYEVDKDVYVTLDPDEIDALKLESKKTIDLVQFVDASDIDYRYFERPYFVAPSDSLAGEGYVVIREALARTGKVGLAQVTIAGREWLVGIAPLGNGLVMELLRYAQELREPEEYFTDIPTVKPQKDLVDLAVQLIDQKAAPFNAAQFTDRFQVALKDLVQQKLKGHTITSPHEERPAGTNVIDLMEALRRSVKQSTAKDSSRTASTTAPPENKSRRPRELKPEPDSATKRSPKTATAGRRGKQKA